MYELGDPPPHTVNRTATVWLIRRFLDPRAEILFVEPEQVAELQRTEAAIGFDAPGARYPHKDDQDPILLRLARILHGADFPDEPASEPEAIGRWAISQGFTDVGRDDPDIVARATFLYDSLYAHLRRAARMTGTDHA